MTPRPPAPERLDGPSRFQAPIGPDGDAGHSPPRAAGAGAALALLLIGVPAALVWLAGPLSWPGSLPGLGDLSGSLGVEQVLAALLVVAWLAWAQFAVCVIVEVVAARRGGVLATPLPLSGPSQRLARTLVASVLVAGTIAIQTGTAFAATDVPPVQPSISAAAQAITAPGGIVPGPDPAGSATAGAAARTASGPSASGPSASTPGYVEAAKAGPAVSGVPSRLGDVELVAHHGATSHDAAAGENSDDAELDGQKVYVVLTPSGQHHDSLWEIAERHLGDGRRYKEIYDLNDGRRQPDGRTLHLARLIQPGWQLIMPEDATGVDRYISTSASRQTPQGDPLAEESPGPGDKVSSEPAQTPAQATDATSASGQASAQASGQASAQASAHADDEAAASGLPGEVSTAPPPGIAAPGLIPSGVVTSNSITAGSRVLPPASEPAASEPAASAPAASAVASSAVAPARSAPAVSAPGTSSAATSSQPRPAPATTGRSTGGKGGWLGAELLGGGLLGAALLAALLLVRRRRGGTTPEDSAAEAEVWLRAGADSDRGTLLDRALRTIGPACAASGVPLPQVYGAVVDNEGIDLLLSAPQPGAPAPWKVLSGGARWRVESADGDLLTGDARSAYPLLASVGRDDQGRDALINLGAAGGPITVLGSPAMASAVVRALALSLAGSAWSRGIEVLACDLPASLPAISAGRLISCPSPEDLTDQLESGSGQLARSGPAQVLTGGPAPGSRPERVAVYGEALPPAVSRRVEELARSGSDLAVLMTGELSAARWRLRVDDTGRLQCEELSLSVTAHRLGDGSIQRLHSLFTAAAASSPRPALADDERPALARPAVESDDIAWAQAGARLALLGEVEVRATGPLEEARAELAAELVSYLALHPAGSHPTVLGSAIWPRGVTSDVRDATIEQVRDWMGTDPDGQYRVRTGHDGRIRLSPSVICDWDVLRTLLGRARQAPAQSRERDLLVRALHLVRGPVAGGPAGGGYSWLARTDLEHQAEELIIDAADQLSQICVQDGDHVGVAQAAAAGLRARPDAQQLWRHILRAEFALGGPARLNAVAEHLTQALSSEGVDMEPQTQALIDHLLTPTGSLPTSQHNPAS